MRITYVRILVGSMRSTVPKMPIHESNLCRNEWYSYSNVLFFFMSAVVFIFDIALYICVVIIGRVNDLMTKRNPIILPSSQRLFFLVPCCGADGKNVLVCWPRMCLRLARIYAWTIIGYIRYIRMVNDLVRFIDCMSIWKRLADSRNPSKNEKPYRKQNGSSVHMIKTHFHQLPSLLAHYVPLRLCIWSTWRACACVVALSSPPSHITFWLGFDGEYMVAFESTQCV